MSGYTIKIRAPFEDAVAVVTTVLEQQSFRVTRSFDLASALDADDPACGCPHHGTDRCTCRYTVLLVYGAQNGGTCPCAITVHTRDAETFLAVSSLETAPVDADSHAGVMEHALLRGLVEASQAALPTR